MAGISETDLPYLALEHPELGDPKLVGGRFMYRGGAKNYRNLFARLGRKKIKFRKYANGHRAFKSAKHAELHRIRETLRRFRNSATHRNALKRNRKYKFYRYAGPGYRSLRSLKRVQNFSRGR